MSALEGFALTWDVRNDAKAEFMEEPVLRKYRDHIRHLHLHDFNGQSDH